jgi:hypothetical protein
LETEAVLRITRPAGQQAQQFYVSGDSQIRLVVTSDGVLTWGSGSAVGDITLYRRAAGTLRTEGTIEMGAALIAPGANQVQIGSDGIIYFSNAYDVAMYRFGAGMLGLNGALVINRANPGDLAIASSKAGDSASRYVVTADGATQWGPGTGASDTNLYRSGVGSLKTDGTMEVNLLTVRATPTPTIYLGADGAAYLFRNGSGGLSYKGAGGTTTQIAPP